MASFQQAQQEGLCLRYPENLGSHPEVNYEMALNMLLRAVSMSHNVPFGWGFIDKPTEGQIMLLFLPPQTPFPIDGIRFQDQEVKFTIPIGTARELEVQEVKFGFIPNSSDANAWRCRRRYRLNKGGDPRLVLVHYTRGPQTPIVPTLMNQPIRNYPLRNVNEPSVYVAGDKTGQKVYPPGAAPMHAAPPPVPMQQPGMAMNFSQQQAMVAQQNNNMEMMERRREQERARNRSGSTTGRPVRPEDDDSSDETDQISTRTLALNRYKRNHDLMNEVFKYAAYGDKNAPLPPSPYHIFNKSELEEKAAKIQAEIEALKTKSESRRMAQPRSEQDSEERRANVSIESFADGITV